MAYNTDVRKVYSDQLEDLKSQGIFKEERAICAPQDSEIVVEFPIGSEKKKVINMCANNYLGLPHIPKLLRLLTKVLIHVGMECLP